MTYVCFTDYDVTIPNKDVAFEKEPLTNTFGEWLAANGKKQARIAETEKYAHVTFFFNGGVEEPNEGEDRFMIPSPKVATYDLKPEMSAPQICDTLIEKIRSGDYDVIITNFANSDMVGHTGVEKAAIEAVECIDKCIGRVVEAVEEVDGQLFICADHGNAEMMVDYETGEPWTAHTTNPVPFILVNYDPAYTLREGGCLADIAPTLIEMMGMEKPAEMTGESLLIKKSETAVRTVPSEETADQEEETYLAGNPEDAAVVILHTNDAHVAMEENIGYDGLALYKKELEEQYDHVLLIDAGDAIQGAPIGAISKGREVIKIMNRLGYDLAVPGNHEFDFGFDELDARSEELECGYTCANFCVTGGECVFKPWRILEAGDLKIGFVGAVAPDTFTKSTIKDILNEVGEPMYDFQADETGERLSAALQKSIDEVRENGADYVILVSHLGNNDSITAQFRCDPIAEKLSGLDMIIDAHSHEIYNRTVKDRTGKEIPIAQAGTKLNAFGQLTIYKDGHLEESLVEEVPKPEHLAFETVTRGKKERYVDPEMKAFLDEIVDSYAEIMERKIGTLAFDMIVRDEDGYDISRVEENGLCDFVADAYRAIGDAQTSFINAGSVRDNLAAGDVTYNSVLNILPFSNDIITVKVTGQMILDALEFGVALLPDISARFPQVSGITFHVNKDIASSVKADEKNQFISVDGDRRVSEVKIGDEVLDPEKEYTLTGSSYLLSGGDGYTMFKDAKTLSTTMLSDSEVVIKYIEENLNGVIPDSYQEASGRLIWDN